MSTIGFIILFNFIGSILSLIGGFILLFNQKFAYRISHHLSAFAAGTLLGAAFFDLMPEAEHEAGETNIFVWTLIGMLTFFLLERFIHWFHHHGDHTQTHRSHVVPLVVLGDSLHNFVDGVAIAAAFLVNIPLGISTTLAVAAHEIPQEIGDFGILIHKGLKPRKVIFLNVLSALASFLGVAIVLMLGTSIEIHLPAILALTAGFFIYIAASDLIPDIHHQKDRRLAVVDSVLLLLGVLVIFVAVTLLHHE
jgi:zinc and cadmium transporter